MRDQKNISTISLLISLLVTTAPLYAADAVHITSQKSPSIETTQKPLAGEFFGYDQKTRKIWIDDYLYVLRMDYRVIGTPTKLGLLSAIKYQEIVQFKTAPNPKKPSIPYVIEIQRR